jgi:hypothetical protein
LLDLRKKVEKELLNCSPIDETIIDAFKNSALKSSGVMIDDFIIFKEGNLLRLTFPEEGIDLEKYQIKLPNKPIPFLKLIFTI